MATPRPLGNKSITVTMGQIRGLKGLEAAIQEWKQRSVQGMFRLFQRLGFKWHAEAVKRAPVETSRLASSLIEQTVQDRATKVITTAVGTNIRSEKGVEYPVFVEFGTRYIAGGRVLALGDNPEITDLQAVHIWPAKEKDAQIGSSGSVGGRDQRGRFTAKGSRQIGTSASIDQSGRTRGRLRDLAGRFTRGPQEQMPWLRPAFMAVKPWFLREHDKLMEPPRQTMV